VRPFTRGMPMSLTTTSVIVVIDDEHQEAVDAVGR
jgi:hypothetical protein